MSKKVKQTEQEEFDRAIYESLIDIWKAYRRSTRNKDASYFNRIFASLYLKSVDKTHRHFIDYMAMALAPAVNRACSGEIEEDE